ncbi:MAG: 2-dehydropantoate 2-reductase [Alphaproteobacteria bacterium]|nr:2-dehydropantoate 2-reductase [Alphaproteobacteria bacterium]
MSEISDNPNIVIAGAGSIGCYVGGRLLHAGRRVKFLGRDRIKAELDEHGLRLTHFEEDEARLSADRIEMSTSPEDALADADIILVAVKSGATSTIAADIARYAPPNAVIVSLQNGITNADKLREGAGSREVVAGMVPFNVAHLGEGRFHQGTSGTILIAAGVPGLLEALTAPRLEIAESEDMPAVMWGKLLINLNNAINALSGIPLKQQLETHAWRQLFADQIAEGLRVLKAVGIKPRPATPVPTALLPVLLRLPTPLFRIIAARMISIDPLARSSMWEDLQNRRMTEIDELQGAVLRLAESVNLDAPICRRITKLVKAAEAAGDGSPGLDVAALRDEGASS